MLRDESKHERANEWVGGAPETAVKQCPGELNQKGGNFQTSMMTQIGSGAVPRMYEIAS